MENFLSNQTIRSVNVLGHTGLEHKYTCKDILNSQNWLSADAYLLCNGKKVDPDAIIESDKIYHVCHRLRGGKGGFGSMLRTIGAQIEKTTNREAMRDLSGRRMRDINNEKKLAEWVAGASEREKQREQRRKERMEKRKAEAEGRMHKFRDEKYMDQKEQVSTNLDDALTQGIKRAAVGGASSGPLSKKGKAPATTVSSWAGVDIDDLSSSEDESGSSNSESTMVRAEVKDTSPEGSATESDTLNVVKEKLESHDSGSSSDSAAEKSADPERSPAMETTEQISTVTEDGQSTTSQSSTETQPRDTDGKSELPNKTTVTSTIDDMEPIDLDTYASAKQLEGCGLERLKQDLIRRGLKCGGSLEQRAQRLYSVKGLQATEIDPSLFAKKKNK